MVEFYPFSQLSGNLRFEHDEKKGHRLCLNIRLCKTEISYAYLICITAKFKTVKSILPSIL